MLLYGTVYELVMGYYILVKTDQTLGYILFFISVNTRRKMTSNYGTRVSVKAVYL